jgi:predicted MFS family arabinose efflux permease
MPFIDQVRVGTERARPAAGTAFFLPGLVTTTWAARLPAIEQDLRLDDAALGAALMCLNVGAIIGLQVGSVLVGRVGSRRTLLMCEPVFCLALIAPAVATNLRWLSAAVLVLAGLNGIVDVAMNAQGVMLEERSQQPALSGLHAMHSAGGIAGAALGALGAHLGVGLTTHFTTTAVAGAAAAAVAARLLPAHEPLLRTERRRVRAWLSGWTPGLLTLGALAFCLTLAEGSALGWSAVFVRDTRGAGPALAATAVLAFMSAMAAGRVSGDRLRQRIGPVRLFRWGALVSGAGIGAAVVIPSPVAGLLGFAALGAGLANLLPVALSAAGHRPGHPAGAVARVSAVAYLGSFTGPAIIGPLAGAAGLGTALLVPAVLVTATAAGASAVAAAGQAGGPDPADHRERGEHR